MNGCEYIGCYDDDGAGRALADQQTQLASTNMTQEICIETCLTGGYSYAGVEYGYVCTTFQSHTHPPSSNPPAWHMGIAEQLTDTFSLATAHSSQCFCGSAITAPHALVVEGSTVSGSGVLVTCVDAAYACTGDEREQCGGFATIDVWYCERNDAVGGGGVGSSSSAVPSGTEAGGPTVSFVGGTSLDISTTTTTTTAAMTIETSTASTSSSSSSSSSPPQSSPPPATTISPSSISPSTSSSSSPATPSPSNTTSTISPPNVPTSATDPSTLPPLSPPLTIGTMSARPSSSSTSSQLGSLSGSTTCSNRTEVFTYTYL